jgi:hypothetical protein
MRRWTVETKSVYVCETCAHRSAKWRFSCPTCKGTFTFVKESPEDFDERGNRKTKPPQLLFFGKVITIAGVTILAYALYASETKKSVTLPVRYGSAPQTGKQLMWAALITLLIGVVLLFMHYSSSNKKK